MINNFSYDLLIIFVKNLNYKDIYKLLRVNKYINNSLSEYFKKRFYYLFVIKLININLEFFKKEILLLKPVCLKKVFIYTLNNIDTVWLNKSQGFYNMKYILECMIIGCRVDKTIQYKFNYTGSHFYQYFYQDLLNCITCNERIIIQRNIDKTPRLKSLHSNFVPFNKKNYIH